MILFRPRQCEIQIAIFIVHDNRRLGRVYRTAIGIKNHAPKIHVGNGYRRENLTAILDIHLKGAPSRRNSRVGAWTILPMPK